MSKKLTMWDLVLLFKEAEFRPMEKADWYAFAGANKGTLIWYHNDTAYLLDRSTDELIVIDEENIQVSYSLSSLEIN